MCYLVLGSFCCCCCCVFLFVFFFNFNLYCALNLPGTYDKLMLSKSSIILPKVTMIANSASTVVLPILLLVEQPDWSCKYPTQTSEKCLFYFS